MDSPYLRIPRSSLPFVPSPLTLREDTSTFLIDVYDVVTSYPALRAPTGTRTRPRRPQCPTVYQTTRG